MVQPRLLFSDFFSAVSFLLSIRKKLWQIIVCDLLLFFSLLLYTNMGVYFMSVLSDGFPSLLYTIFDVLFMVLLIAFFTYCVVGVFFETKNKEISFKSFGSYYVVVLIAIAVLYFVYQLLTLFVFSGLNTAFQPIVGVLLFIVFAVFALYGFSVLFVVSYDERSILLSLKKSMLFLRERFFSLTKIFIVELCYVVIFGLFYVLFGYLLTKTAGVYWLFMALSVVFTLVVVLLLYGLLLLHRAMVFLLKAEY